MVISMGLLNLVTASLVDSWDEGCYGKFDGKTVENPVKQCEDDVDDVFSPSSLKMNVRG